MFTSSVYVDKWRFKMTILLLILLATIIAYLAKLYINNVHNYWSNRGVRWVIKPYPLFGSLTPNVSKTKQIHERIMDMYDMYPDARYVGIHQLMQPCLLLRDVGLIKEMTVKEFDSFTDRRVVLTEEYEPIFGKNLLSLKGEKWKNMRSTLSPAFTSSKMRIMLNLMNDCSQHFIKYALKEAKRTNNIVTLEMKDSFTRYTNDVIASTALGIEVDSFENKENDIYESGKSATNFSRLVYATLMFMIVPRLAKLLGVRFVKKKDAKFFSETIHTTVKIREEQGIVRPDMLHLLIQARKKQLKHEDVVEDAGFATVEESSVGKSKNSHVMTDEDIVAQAFLFFFAGYETTSTMMSFMAYELTVNPEIQKKLQTEIDEYLQNSDGKLDYDVIRSMKYLDMVVSESLRKWPPAVVTERICTKSYILKNEDGTEIKLDKGDNIWIPIYSLHHNPQYFPNPERFDPERFNDENKKNIIPFTYLPFGAGPRNCIGSRFALLEIKILFVRLLETFDFVVVKETQIPLKLDKNKFNMIAENGMWIGLKPRN